MSESVQTLQNKPCSSCGNEILTSPLHRDRVMQFRDPDTDPGEHNILTFTLCNECEAKIVDWIRNDESTERGVNTVGMEFMADEMEQTAEELNAVASLFRDRLRGEHDD